MKFYPDKYSVIRITRKKTIHRYHYTLHGQILTEETKTKHLGVTIADNMIREIRSLAFQRETLKSIIQTSRVSPTRPWSDQLSSTAAWFGTHTTKSVLKLQMVQCWAAKWVKNNYVQQC